MWARRCIREGSLPALRLSVDPVDGTCIDRVVLSDNVDLEYNFCTGAVERWFELLIQLRICIKYADLSWIGIDALCSIQTISNRTTYCTVIGQQTCGPPRVSYTDYCSRGIRTHTLARLVEDEFMLGVGEAGLEGSTGTVATLSLISRCMKPWR
jgi:hypothetical protein